MATIQDTITLTATDWRGMVRAQRYEYGLRNPTFEEAGEPYPSLTLRQVEQLVDYWNRELGRRFPDPPNTDAWQDAERDVIEPWRRAWQGVLEAASSVEHLPGVELTDETLPLGEMPELWRHVTDLAVLMDGDIPADLQAGGQAGELLRIPTPYTMPARRKKKKKKKSGGDVVLFLLILLALDE